MPQEAQGLRGPDVLGAQVAPGWRTQPAPGEHAHSSLGFWTAPWLVWGMAGLLSSRTVGRWVWEAGGGG